MTWDFEKGLLAFMAALTVGCIGVAVWQQSQTADLVKSQRTSEDQLARIGLRAQDINILNEEIRRDDIAQGTAVFDYLERQMKDSRIGLKFKVDTKSQPKEYDGYTDYVYGVSAIDREVFDRDAIGKFLLFIEANTARMKVTRIKLDAVDKRAEIVEEWKPTIEVTDRQATTIN